jgi:hypothetical protein
MLKKASPAQAAGVIKISRPARNFDKNVVASHYYISKESMCCCAIPYRVAYRIQLGEIVESSAGGLKLGPLWV